MGERANVYFADDKKNDEEYSGSTSILIGMGRSFPTSYRMPSRGERGAGMTLRISVALSFAR